MMELAIIEPPSEFTTLPLYRQRPLDLVFRDPAMEAVVSRAERVARADASVLINGESGTGKEVVARFIHRHSPRAAGPFIAVNCAAIPEQLLESELFGHERGAFSGALMQRIGKLEAAQNGTILLDEISEMDRHLQAKLLRALQEREVDRVGGRTPVKVNIRVIATTNRDLEREVRRGAFREDLYFRLNVVGVALPALRDRPGDILTLAEHFLGKHRGDQPVRHLSAGAESALLAHDWPGNVRELENTIQRALVLTTGPLIRAEELEITASRPSVASGGLTTTAGRPLHVLEREAILATLRMTGGNRTRTASVLGLSIRALRNKIGLYAAQGIEVPPSTAARV